MPRSFLVKTSYPPRDMSPPLTPSPTSVIRRHSPSAFSPVNKSRYIELGELQKKTSCGNGNKTRIWFFVAECKQTRLPDTPPPQVFIWPPPSRLCMPCPPADHVHTPTSPERATDAGMSLFLLFKHRKTLTLTPA